jgi:DNA helicase TIP49 (TBP-interacting protein)
MTSVRLVPLCCDSKGLGLTEEGDAIPSAAGFVGQVQAREVRARPKAHALPLETD